jgi:galactokinase/mevalonate kinase-like predicted kinase
VAKTLPAVPDHPTQDVTDPDKNEKKLHVLDKQKKQMRKYEDETNEALKRIEDSISKTFKFVCALRLDMVSDLLDRMKKKDLSYKIDAIANEIEKTIWKQ